jgi:hypothetical protein
MKYALFWMLRLRRLVLTDVSGQHIFTIFKGQAMEDEGFLPGFLDH